MSDAMPDERWLPVVGFEGLYEVSDQGQVRSLDRLVRARNGRTKRLRGRVLRPVEHSSGGGRRTVAMSKQGHQERQLIAHLVAAAFLGPRPDGQLVRHWNDDPSDDQVSNLLYGTYSDNNHDRVRNGHDHETAKTQCPRGHDLELPNLVASQREAGGRSCLACARARANVHAHPEVDFVARADEHYRAIMAGLAEPVGVARTHCARRHLLQAPNLVASALAKNVRVCLACSRATSNVKRDPALDMQTRSDEHYARIMSEADQVTADSVAPRAAP